MCSEQVHGNAALGQAHGADSLDSIQGQPLKKGHCGRARVNEASSGPIQRWVFSGQPKATKTLETLERRLQSKVPWKQSVPPALGKRKTADDTQGSSS